MSIQEMALSHELSLDAENAGFRSGRSCDFLCLFLRLGEGMMCRGCPSSGLWLSLQVLQPPLKGPWQDA